MDLNQRKLNKSEWDALEIQVSKQELDVLNLITNGYHDVNIRINNNLSLLSYLKMAYSEKMEDYLYNTYLRSIIDNMVNKYHLINPITSVDNNIKINSADKIRLDKSPIEVLSNKSELYEYILLFHTESFLSLYTNFKSSSNDTIKNQYINHYFTLFNLLKNNIQRLNKYIILFCNKMIETFSNEMEMTEFVKKKFSKFACRQRKYCRESK